MPAALHESLAEGVADLAEAQGNPSWAFGAATFVAPASTIRTDDPRMQGSNDRLLEIIIPTSQLPVPAPAKGNQLTRSGKFHRVVRVDTDAATGLTSIVVTA